MFVELKRRENESKSSATATAPRRLIVINCFGRGGSSILWNMIGSSPDVIMTDFEWHQAVFGSARRIRKLVTLCFWQLGISSIAPLRRKAHNALLSMQSLQDLREKDKGCAIVTKVMDYHMAFNQMIAKGFDDASYVVLTRHPYGQCESLMRSGLSLRNACKWYSDIAGAMVKTLKNECCVLVRFEELIQTPVQSCDKIYASLAISWRPDRRFRLKRKEYGESRQGDSDFSENRFEWIGLDNVAHFIDASVVESATKRLSSNERREIWCRTSTAAKKLGYERDALTAVESGPGDR